MAEAKVIKMSDGSIKKILTMLGIEIEGVSKLRLEFEYGEVVKAHVERLVYANEVDAIVGLISEAKQ